jgi:hypothetical protein
MRHLFINSLTVLRLGRQDKEAYCISELSVLRVKSKIINKSANRTTKRSANLCHSYSAINIISCEIIHFVILTRI